MLIKHPKFKFLNKNENPTLQEIRVEVQKGINTTFKEDEFSDMMLFIGEILDLKKIQIGNIYQQCTLPVANLYIVFQAIGCFQSGGLAVGIFGNAPYLMPYLSYALEETGYTKEAESIEWVKNTFPLKTDFFYPELYNDILNFMENPKRKTTHSQTQNISMEEKQKHHQSYIKALDKAEPILEQTWFEKPYDKLKAYCSKHSAKTLFSLKNQ